MYDNQPSPGFQPPPPIGVQLGGLNAPGFTTPGGSPPPSGSSKGARTAAIVLAVLLVVVAVGAGVMISKSNSEADDAKAELADVRDSLDSLESDAGSVEDRIDELLDQQDADEQAKAELESTIDDLNAQIDDLTAQVDAGGDTEALQAELDDVNARLEQTQTELDQALTDLDAANAALADAQDQPAAGSFDVEPATIRPTLGNFSVTTNRIDCEGWADPAAACPDTLPLNGRFVLDGTQLFMEFANVAKVPIASFDGFNYSGSTPATNDASSLCGGQVVPATMSVQVAPVRYSIDAATQAITATAFSFTWTIFSEESANCTGSTRTYSGTIDL